VKNRTIRRRYVLLAVVAMLSTLAACSSSSSPISSTPSSPSTSSSANPSSAGSTPAAPAGDIGISATQIHVAFIADVNNPIAPGLDQAALNAVRAWTSIVNAHGGLAGRQVVLDFCDSKLDVNAATNCVIQACQSDFAMITEIGSFGPVADMQQCPDQQGAKIGLPNLAAYALGTPEACSPDTFIAQGGDASLCATLNQPTKTYTVSVGDFRYYASHFSGLHGLFLYNGDVPALAPGVIATLTGATTLGIKNDGTQFYTSSSAAPQSALIPYALDLKRSGSTFAYDGVYVGNDILLRREAALQGVNTVKLWACFVACYDESTFLKPGGAAVNGTYMPITTLPFYSESGQNAALTGLLKQLGSQAGTLDQNGLSAYLAALLFQDAVQKVAAGGGGSLNRQTLLTALKNEHSFNAEGIIGPTDVGDGKLSPCVIIMHVVNGQFQRAFPTQPGSFDCNPANLAQVKLAS
jgi:hypothetical protein